MNYLKVFLPYLFGNKVGSPLNVNLPERSLWLNFSFEEQLTFHTLSDTQDDFFKTLKLDQLSSKEIFHLLNFYPFFQRSYRSQLEAFFGEQFALLNQSKKYIELDSRQLQELLDFNSPKLCLYALLKSDRKKKGMLLMKGQDGRFIKNANGDVWAIPILGHTKRGIGFNHSFGPTPCGIYTIDGVMPHADQNIEYGRHRRLIINFLPALPHHEEYTEKLPLSHWKLNWWKQSLVAKLLGRSLLRIHGTGQINPNIFQSFFPFVPTSGCLATKEIPLLPKHMAHQRELLDVMMASLGHLVSEQNESKIHGLLYVVEYNGNGSELRFRI